MKQSIINTIRNPVSRLKRKPKHLTICRNGEGKLRPTAHQKRAILVICGINLSDFPKERIDVVDGCIERDNDSPLKRGRITVVVARNHRRERLISLCRGEKLPGSLIHRHKSRRRRARAAEEGTTSRSRSVPGS